MTLIQVQRLILREAKRHGSKAAFARHVGITPQQLQHALRGLPPCAALLEALGLERVVVYRRKKP